MDYFSQHIVSDTETKNPGLLFLQNFYETMTAGYFLGGGGGGGEGGNLLPLQIGSNIIVSKKILHPQDPPTTSSYANIIPPLQNIPRTYPVHISIYTHCQTYMYNTLYTQYLSGLLVVYVCGDGEWRVSDAGREVVLKHGAPG